MDHIFDNGYTDHVIELFSELIVKTENGEINYLFDSQFKHFKEFL